MGKRGPKPQNQLRAVDIQPARAAINPPEGMSARDRGLFRRIVAAMPARHFRVQDIPLLREYCEAAGRAKDAGKLIREHGLVVKGDRGQFVKNPAVQIATSAAQVMALMAVKLRLCPSARSAAGDRGEVPDIPASPPTSKRRGLLYNPDRKK